jgi:hypothetical protein
MKSLARGVLTTAVVAAVGAAIGAYAWYRADRTGMLQSLCEAGLPNLSRPSIVDADDLDCTILGPRRRVKGVLLTGFEASGFIENDLPPPPKGGGFTGGTWWTCNQVRGCDRKVEKQLERPVPGLCDTSLASVVVYGWPTVTPGRYGHLGVYAREFFVDEVESAGPPPPALVDRMHRQWAKAGLDKCS